MLGRPRKQQAQRGPSRPILVDRPKIARVPWELLTDPRGRRVAAVRWSGGEQQGRDIIASVEPFYRPPLAFRMIGNEDDGWLMLVGEWGVVAPGDWVLDCSDGGKLGVFVSASPEFFRSIYKRIKD